MKEYLVTHTITMKIKAQHKEEAKEQSFNWLYAECPETWDVEVELMEEGNK